MKIRTILASMLAVAALAGCSKDDGGNNPGAPDGDAGVAYLSIKLETQKTTRAGSDENDGDPAESELKKLYMVTFDGGGNVVAIPDGGYYVRITPGSTEPDAFKISAAATRLLVVANPGPKFDALLSSINRATTFTTVNSAIVAVNKNGITNELVADQGFVMINSGDETGKNPGDKITTPLIDISAYIQKVTDSVDDDTAQENAEKPENRVKIKIERLASKVGLKLKDPIEANGAFFTFQNWTLDAVNSTLYPFAEKTVLSVVHNTVDGFYVNNFYTEDPNFTGAVGSGLTKVTIDGATYAPKMIPEYGWLAADATKPTITYCIENTMAAAEQKYGNATRVVIKGAYYPADHTTQAGDWFSYEGKNYLSFAELQTAYATAGSGLKGACDNMLVKVKEYLTTKNGSEPVGLDTFTDLTQDILDEVENGGEAIKNGANPVVHWYQDGLCYYYYEIRHDNVATAEMAFAKYGVVRNNWYSLTLNSIKEAGTPWYPDIDHPGPGDPDPTDPIDEATGYLGVTISVAPWIIWDNGIDL